MSASTSYEFDLQNKSDYDDNTNKINAALEKIEKDKTLSATFTELARQTGLHRNTLSRDKRHTEIIGELKRIKQVKKNQSEFDSVIKKDTLEDTEALLEKAKTELIHWFTKLQDITLEFEQMEIQLSRRVELVDWYKRELEKERLKVKSLKERINLMEELKK